MLKSIHIQNFALIDQLQLDLKDGLTILTGETGAGKSIILGALGLLQGNRADLSVVRDKTVKCIVEAEFSVKSLGIKSVFEDLDLDYEDHSLLRREIMPSGKSRAFINDTPVTLDVMKQIGGRLIDIHSQHQTLNISSDLFQREVLDAFIKNATQKNKLSFQSILEAYQSLLKEFRSNKRQLDELDKKKAELLKEQDYNAFLLDELEQIPLDKLNEDDINEELNQLSNVESIEVALQSLMDGLGDDENGILDRLRVLKSSISEIGGFSDKYASLKERLDSVIIELEDVLSETDHLADQVTADPERLDILSNQLNQLNSLYKKHQVDDVRSLIDIRNKLADKILDSQSMDSKIKKLNGIISVQENELHEKASDLMGLRNVEKTALEEQVLEIAGLLGMPDAVFSIKIAETVTFNDYGKDEISFLFSANKGSVPLELNKAASGGELSRLMLAIKSILGNVKKLPTIIFDEIDTGVSGRIADKMALVMKNMSEKLQVITITHLPQIAASGTDHLVVSKKNQDDRTVSTINRLNEQERIEEIAQMLSGGVVTNAARENAKTLLN
ncbi:DNA repair protein RecN [Nonlabens spongiae]|uniref:DNA repair protein RecN n=1 Tax=Nonlabens spongiae TaxID=331648 RepID=A0A1W6MJT1_9FLAO|nr:DNA repair protein RecN [Nonlabens spongiae]ARN77827.1 DNA repair protein RecN [Nonlabens spongiae]